MSLIQEQKLELLRSEVKNLKFVRQVYKTKLAWFEREIARCELEISSTEDMLRDGGR